MTSFTTGSHIPPAILRLLRIAAVVLALPLIIPALVDLVQLECIRRVWWQENRHPSETCLRLAAPRLTPDERLVLFGDLSQTNPTDQQKGIWLAHPDNLVYLNNWISTLLCSDSPAEKTACLAALREAETADPHNGRFNYLRASLLEKDAADQNLLRQHRVSDFFTTEEIPNPIRDRQAWDAVMAEIRRGLDKPENRALSAEMWEERLRITGQLRSGADQALVATLGLKTPRAAASDSEGVQLDTITEAILLHAKLLVHEKRAQEAVFWLEHSLDPALQMLPHARDEISLRRTVACAIRVEAVAPALLESAGRTEAAAALQHKTQHLQSVMKQWIQDQERTHGPARRSVGDMPFVPGPVRVLHRAIQRENLSRDNLFLSLWPVERTACGAALFLLCIEFVVPPIFFFSFFRRNRLRLLEAGKTPEEIPFFLNWLWQPILGVFITVIAYVLITRFWAYKLVTMLFGLSVFFLISAAALSLFPSRLSMFWFHRTMKKLGFVCPPAKEARANPAAKEQWRQYHHVLSTTIHNALALTILGLLAIAYPYFLIQSIRLPQNEKAVTLTAVGHFQQEERIIQQLRRQLLAVPAPAPASSTPP